MRRRVSFVVAGFEAKRLKAKIEYNFCTEGLTGKNENCESYFNLLSRNKLGTPSQQLAHFVSLYFAVLDIVETSILQHYSTIYMPIRAAADFVLKSKFDCLLMTCHASMFSERRGV